MLGAKGLAPELRIAGLVLLVVTVSAVQAGMLMGFESYRAMAAASLVGGTASAVLLAPGAQLGGVAGALYGLSVACAAQTLVNHLLIRRARNCPSSGPSACRGS